MNPEPILARLERLHPKVIDLSLGRIERLLARLGNPERDLPPVVHVAGTNGKGSLLACLEAMLGAAGKRVHLYTSPHLVRFNERIRLAGSAIEDGALAGVLGECEAANDGAPITFFEITTAAGFLAMARSPADVALLETGLGGRLDATNVIARPVVTAITPVSRDHEHYLGTGIAEIAAEKAGIIKPGVSVVLGPQLPEAAAVLRATAAARSAPVHAHGTDFEAQAAGAGLVYRSAARALSIPSLGLVGAHQVDNAATAIACLERLDGIAVDDRAVARGLARVTWPGRLQRLDPGAVLGAEWELWLDGGHNDAAAAALAAAVAASWRDRPLYLVCAMLANKAPAGFLAPLAPFAEALWAIPIAGDEAAHAPEMIAAAGAGAGLRATVAADLTGALAEIAATGAPGRVLICGSLRLAGQVLGGT